MTTREEAQRLADALGAILAGPRYMADDYEPTLTNAAALLRQWPDAGEPVAIADGTFNCNAPLGTPLYAAPPAAQPGSMPIESAPKSTSDILLISRNGNFRIETGGFAHHMIDAAKVDGDECLFTHWMPLPPPPGKQPAAQPAGMVVTECNDNDSPWLVCKTCQAAGKCKQEQHGWLRPEVVAFANLMERELRNNDHKGGWKDDAPGRLLERAEEEMRELHAALLSYPRDTRKYRYELASEGADVANMVMMVLDVCGALAASPSQPAAPAVEPLTERIAVLEMALRKVSMNAVFTGNGECSLSFAIVKEVDAALAAIERAHGITQGEQHG